MLYQKFRKYSKEDKIKILNEDYPNLKDRIKRVEYYYLFKHDDFYGKKYLFFKDVNFKELNKFCKSLNRYLKMNKDVNTLLAFYYILKKNTVINSSRSKRIKDLNNIYIKILREEYNKAKIEKYKNSSFKKGLINFEEKINNYSYFLEKQKERKDVNFFDAPYDDISIGEVNIYNNLFPTEYIMNIGLFEGNEEDYINESEMEEVEKKEELEMRKKERYKFLHYKATENFVNYIYENESQFYEFYINMTVNNKKFINSLNYIPYNKIFIIESILKNLNDKNYFNAMQSLALIIENILTNIIRENIVNYLIPIDKEIENKKCSYNKYGILNRYTMFYTCYEIITRDKDILDMPESIEVVYKKDIDLSTVQNIYSLFLFKGGPNLRNSVAHGMITEKINFKSVSLYLFYLLCSICIK